ncbi:N-acetylmuramoyl-L-alanine amidase [Streptomyces sp. NPDC005780]|uniref:N-acetylmuramoyl-L-alanine amidase n=1 Tax=Streptomyces sp. NPDC005780 TaxID=3364730 RepID=UPI0036A9987C
MARMPGATWHAVGNFTKDGQDSVRGVVVHIMAGTLEGSQAWFDNPTAQASSHFGTGKGGALRQWVDTDDRAWAQSAGNRTWLSVENEGVGGDVLSDAQLDRNAQVLAWAHQEYDVPLRLAAGPDDEGLGYHAMGGSAWGGHTSCPGPRIVAQLPEIVARAKQLVAEPQQEEDPMAGYSTAEIGDAVLYRDHIEAPADDPNVKKNPFWTLASYIRSIYNAVNTVRQEQRETRAKVDALTKAVADLAKSIKES